MKRIDFGEESRLFKSGAGASRATHDADLPELVIRILSDFARIIGAEARLVEATVIGVTQAFLDRLYVAMVMMILGLAGLVAVVGSVIALLHHWLPWWQVFGVVGVGCIILAAILKFLFMPSDVPFYELPPGNQS